MKTKLAATLVIAALSIPLAVQAQSTTDKVKENVGDSVITTKIKAEMAKDKTVAAHTIKVDTDNKGVVTLSGTAKSSMEADKAVSIARGTKGVVSVQNNIQVKAN